MRSLGCMWKYIHTTNLLIHLLAASDALSGVVRRTLFLRTGLCGNRPGQFRDMVGGEWRRCCGSVHPLDTQSVTYVVQRSESLASLFLLASIYCVIRAADGRKGWGVAAVFACGLGMASKGDRRSHASPCGSLRSNVSRGAFKAALTRQWKIYAGMAAMWAFILFSLHTGGRETMVGIFISASHRSNMPGPN